MLGVLGMLGVGGYRDDPPTFPEINPPGTAVSVGWKPVKLSCL